MTFPDKPAKSTNDNGFTELRQYETTFAVPAGSNALPMFKASSDDPDVKISVVQPKSKDGKATITFNHNGKEKIYVINLVDKAD